MPSVLQAGEKIHVATRRVFPEDVRRHFVGTVEVVEGDVARIRGHVFVYHSGTGEYERRPDERSRILGIAEAMHVINVLPTSIDLEALHYTTSNGHLVVTDGAGYVLDINEFGPRA